MKLLVVAICLGLLAVPGLAFGRRRASRSERAAVVRAAERQGDIGRQQAPCVVIYVSNVNRAWSSLSFPEKPSRACLPFEANGVSLYHWSHGRWRFVTAGDEFRCPIGGVPSRVAHDLRVC